MRFCTILISIFISFINCTNKSSIDTNINCFDKILTDSVFMDTIFSVDFHGYPFYELFSYSIHFDSLFSNEKIIIGKTFVEFEGFSHKYYLNGKLFNYSYTLGYTDKSMADNYVRIYSKNIKKTIETNDAYICTFSDEFDSTFISLNILNFKDSLKFSILNNSSIEFDEEYMQMLYSNLKSFKKLKFKTDSQRSECINRNFPKLKVK